LQYASTLIKDRVKVPGQKLRKRATEEMAEKPLLEDGAVKDELVTKELIMEIDTAWKASEKRHPRRGSQVSGMK
jgi:hypothetical protein